MNSKKNALNDATHRYRSDQLSGGARSNTSSGPVAYRVTSSATTDVGGCPASAALVVTDHYVPRLIPNRINGAYNVLPLTRTQHDCTAGMPCTK